jgi:hypothetical protein
MLSFWKMVIVAAVGFLVFRRIPLPRHPIFRLLQPWPAKNRRTSAGPAAPPTPWMQDRVFVFLLVTTATGVAAWIVTRMIVMAPSAASH